jgi:hypothetical protein
MVLGYMVLISDGVDEEAGCELQEGESVEKEEEHGFWGLAFGGPRLLSYLYPLSSRGWPKGEMSWLLLICLRSRKGFYLSC